MPISSINGYITVGEDDSNVIIDNDNLVIFNEFNQANININYTATVARAKTTFRITELDQNGNKISQTLGALGNISQVSYRNDVVRGDGSLQIQFTGGSATLYIQSAVGRTTNISRGIIGAPGKRPTGNFKIKVELLASKTPSGQPELVDTLIINGIIKPIFVDPLIVSFSQERGKMKYSISLSEEDILTQQFLYGFKIKNIASGVTIHKGRTTVFNNDTFQVSAPSFEITSSGGNSSVSFDVVAIDIDKQERQAKINISTFDFSNKNLTVTYPNNVEAIGQISAVPGFIVDGDNYAIWSASDRTTYEGKQSRGKIRLTLPNDIPASDSQLEWTLYGFNKNSELENIVTVNNREMVDGVISGVVNVNSSHNYLELLVVSKNYKNGTLKLSCKIARNTLSQNLAFANGTIGVDENVLTLKLVENIPEADGIPKRVYLHDNTKEYTIDPFYDDSNTWTMGANVVDGLLTEYCEGERIAIAKFINNCDDYTFNLQYGDHNAESKSNFGTYGDLGMHIKWDSLTVIPKCGAPNSCDFRLAVNPETYSKFGCNTSYIQNDHSGKRIDTEISINSYEETTTTTITTYNISADGCESLEEGTEQHPNPKVIIADQKIDDTNDCFTIYERTIPDNVMKVRANGFYGSVKLTYDVTEKIKNLELIDGEQNPNYVSDYKSFRSVTSRLYLLPKVDPIATLERYKGEDEDDMQPTTDTKFSSCEFVKYLVTVKNGDQETAYNYISDESNQYIKEFLKSKNKLRVDYSKTIPTVFINGREKSESVANEIIKFGSEVSFKVNEIYKSKRNQCISNAYSKAVMNGLGLTIIEGKFDRHAHSIPSYEIFSSVFNSSLDKAINKALEDGNYINNKSRNDIIGSGIISSDTFNGGSYFPSPGPNASDPNATNDIYSQRVYKMYKYLIDLFDCSIYQKIIDYIQVDKNKLPYSVNGYDELNWMCGESRAFFDLIPLDAVSGKYKTQLELQFTSLTGNVEPIDLDQDTIIIYIKDSNRDLCASKLSILGVPLVAGFEMYSDCTLIKDCENLENNETNNYVGWCACQNKSDVDSCTTVVIKNGSKYSINVTTTDLITSSDAIYVSNSPSSVQICPGKTRVFIRIMYKPVAWEPSHQEF